MIQDTQNITKFKIDDTDVFLEDFEPGQGKIIISDSYDKNYSYYWGSMGDNISDFICRINSEYFADKLLMSELCNTVDFKKTFAAIRKYIREEIGLSFYNEMEFQKDMRKVLRKFQKACEENDSERYFVDNFFTQFIDRLDFYLMEDKFNQQDFASSFGGISEHWQFLNHKPSKNYIWLIDFHKKLKKEIKKNTNN